MRSCIAKKSERAFVTVSKVLNSGTFSFVDSRSATRITGRFTCR